MEKVLEMLGSYKVKDNVPQHTGKSSHLRVSH